MLAVSYVCDSAQTAAALCSTVNSDRPPYPIYKTQNATTSKLKSQDRKIMLHVMLLGAGDFWASGGERSATCTLTVTRGPEVLSPRLLHALSTNSRWAGGWPRMRCQASAAKARKGLTPNGYGLYTKGVVYAIHGTRCCALPWHALYGFSAPFFTSPAPRLYD